MNMPTFKNIRFAYTLSLMLSLLFTPAISHASTLVRSNQTFCDTTKTICIKGTIRVDPNQGIARLNGRIKTKTRPGFLRITLYGYQEKRISVAYIQGRLDGKRSEIVNLKNGASQHTDTRWVLHRVEYLPTQ